MLTIGSERTDWEVERVKKNSRLTRVTTKSAINMGALEHIKEIAVLVQKYQDQDLYQRIVDLRDEIFELREENLLLKEKVKQMQEAGDISSQLTRKQNFYYRTLPDGSIKGPFCMACWDGDRKLVNIQVFSGGFYQCGRCEPNKLGHKG